MNLPERRVEQQRSPADPESNITELRPTAVNRVSAEFRAEAFNLSGDHPLPGSAFWSELNSTLEEFFIVIGQSRDRIVELSTEVAKRDGIISLLEAQIFALKARLGVADSAPSVRTVVPPMRASEPNASAPATDSSPGEIRKERGIWGKLSDLERDAE